MLQRRERRGGEWPGRGGGGGGGKDGGDSDRRWQRGRTAENEMSPSQTLPERGCHIPNKRRTPRVAFPRASRGPASQSGALPVPAFDRPPGAWRRPPPRRTTAGHGEHHRAGPGIWPPSCVVQQNDHPPRQPRRNMITSLIPMLPTGIQVYLLLSCVLASNCLLRPALLASLNSNSA